MTGNEQRADTAPTRRGADAAARSRAAALVVTLVLSAGYLWIGTRSRPPRALEDVPDAVTHLGGYALLAWSATDTAARFALAPAAAWGAGWAVANGALLELLQGRTATRRAEWRDLVADAVGAVIGAAVARRRRATP
jgi:VanZ family protein